MTRSKGNDTPRIRIHLEIEGRVQGVFYRASARSKASVLGLGGWVRNRPDGTVEAEAEGLEDAVETFVAWCHEGPPGAAVTAVRTRRIPATGQGPGFELRF